MRVRSDRWGRLVGVAVTVAGGMAASGCGGRSLTPSTELVSEKPFALFVPGTASPERKARLIAIAPRLDELLQAKMRQSGATALAAGVVLDGELAYARAWGARKVAAPGTKSTANLAAVDADTVFRIASMTKSFTAMAILKLRDQGRIALDADASIYLPVLRTLGGLPRDATVTVRMLLTHASGLPGDDYWGGDTFGMTIDGATGRILDLDGHPPRDPDATCWQ